MKYKYYGNDVKDIKPINNDFPYIKSPRDLYDALSHIWSINTCAPRLREGWSKKNKTLGQCSITSMLVPERSGVRNRHPVLLFTGTGRNVLPVADAART